MLAPSTAAQSLGLDSAERAVILSCDLLGFSHSHNCIISQGLADGFLTSARAIVPAPWIRDAVKDHQGEDVGLNIVLNSEHPIFHFGPITQAPTLLDGSGGFPPTLTDLWEHADLEEVRREIRAQLERAFYWGFDISHLSSHLNALIEKPEFFDLLTDLAQEFQLPLRFPRTAKGGNLGFPAVELAQEKGVFTTDDAFELERLVDGQITTVQEMASIIVDNLSAGVTDVSLKISVDTPEIRALCNSWEPQVQLGKLSRYAPELRSILSRNGVRVISYRDLRDACRNTRQRRSNFSIL